MKKIMRIGFVLAMLGLMLHFFPTKWLAGYEEVGRNGILVLFAIGWSLSLGGLVFQLGIENQKKREQESIHRK